MLDPAGRTDRARARAAPQSTGRRLALARWLSRRGQSAFDAGDRQPHLAVSFRPRACGHAQRLRASGRASQPSRACSTGWRRSFVRQGWRLKPLHRLIVTSAAYRQSASREPREIAVAATGGSGKSIALEANASSGSTPRKSATPCSLRAASSGGADRRPERFEQSVPAHDRHPHHPQLARRAARISSMLPTATPPLLAATRRPQPRRLCS